jgi:hypothetical protein
MWSKSAIPGGTDPYIRGKGFLSYILRISMQPAKSLNQNEREPTESNLISWI